MADKRLDIEIGTVIRLMALEKQSEQWRTPETPTFGDFVDLEGLLDARTYAKIANAINYWGESRIRRWGVSAAVFLGSHRVLSSLSVMSGHGPLPRRTRIMGSAHPVPVDDRFASLLDGEPHPLSSARAAILFEEFAISEAERKPVERRRNKVERAV